MKATQFDMAERRVWSRRRDLGQLESRSFNWITHNQ